MTSFCTNVTLEKIRARIAIGGVSIRTPYVKSFSINKTREKLAATFSASLEIYAGIRLYLGSDVEIYDEVNGSERKLFTGEIRDITTQPSFDKAGYYIISISGTDKLGILEGKTFSRRLRSDGFSLFVSIDGGPKNRAKRGVSIDKKIRNGSHQITSTSPNVADITSGGLSSIIYMPKRNADKHGMYARANPLTGTEKGTGSSGTGVHDHTTLIKGGPAFGVYAVD